MWHYHKHNFEFCFWRVTIMPLLMFSSIWNVSFHNWLQDYYIVSPCLLTCFWIYSKGLRVCMITYSSCLSSQHVGDVSRWEVGQSYSSHAAVLYSIGLPYYLCEVPLQWQGQLRVMQSKWSTTCTFQALDHVRVSNWFNYKSAGYRVTRQAAVHLYFMMTVMHFGMNSILNNMQHLTVVTVIVRTGMHFESKSDVSLNSLLSNT